MRDPYELIRRKEEDIKRIHKEIDALRVAARLLGDENEENEASNLRQVIPMP